MHQGSSVAKISVITPSYNQGEFIERTIQSVLQQKSAEFDIEYVVFDGASTDDTIQILKRYDSEIRWTSEKDNGQTDAVNKGIKSTDGDIIAWINSDDVYYQNAFQRVFSCFQSNPDVEVVYGMADHIDLDDHPFENYPTEPWGIKRLMETCIICQPALFFKRSVVEKHGLLNESLNYCMDYEYWLRMAKSGVKFSYLEKKLAGSRLYAENKTLGSRVKVHEEINDMFRELFGKVPDRWLFNYAHALVNSETEKTTPLTKLKLGLISLKSALRWNRSVSFEMYKTIFKWFVK